MTAWPETSSRWFTMSLASAIVASVATWLTAADVPVVMWTSNQESSDSDDRCATTELTDAKLNHKSIDEVTQILRVKDEPKDCFQAASGSANEVRQAPISRGFAEQRYHWRASGLFHEPLYFEDVSLERYGQTHLLQPVVSGLKFFATVPILPYKMGLDHPHEHIHTLGYQRAGNCACPVKERLPFSWKGAALEAAAATGFVFLFP